MSATSRLPRVATEYGQRSWARVIRSAACPAVRFGARQLSLPGFSSFLSFDLDALGVSASPVAVLDDFRVLGLPLCPHPHSGFAAVTYVLEDLPADLRGRASSGIDPASGIARERWATWRHSHILIPARRPVSDPAGTGSEQIRFAC